MLGRLCSLSVVGITLRGPVRVNRYRSTHPRREGNVRFTSESDQTGASQRSDALCQLLP